MALERRSPMKRGGGIKRSRIKSRPIRRLWSAAIEKRDAEGRCRVCGHPGSFEWPLEAAHVVGREFDEKVSGKKVRVVDADGVIPLCRRCHQMQHQRRLSLLGSLTMRELRYAVRVCKEHGLDVRRRITGSRDA